MKNFRISDEFAPKPGTVYSFMSPVNYFKLGSNETSCTFYCDGMLAAWLFSRILGRRIPRLSFDLGSIAQVFLTEQERRGLSVLFVGGRPDQKETFLSNLNARFPKLKAECASGYPPGGFSSDDVLNDLNEAAARYDSVVLSLGAPLQERVALALHRKGYKGTLLTAGAFVSQTAAGQDGNYYPAWMNRLHLRFAWRLIKEPHTRTRFPLVLLFPFALAMDLLLRRVHISSAAS